MAARNPNNNPTDRILRLLAEMDEMAAAYESLYERAIGCNMPMDGIMPWPPMVEFRLEMMRQGNTYLRVRPNVLRTRDRMQRMREMDALRGEPYRERKRQPIPRHRKNPPTMVESPDYKMDFSNVDDELAQQLAEDEKMFAEQKAAKQKLIDDTIALSRPRPATIMPAKIAPGNEYKPDIKNLFSKTKPTED